jgi:8-amino-7-oxononanoate synthase
MDGSVAPLAEIVQLKQRYGAMLMVDEAHSGGVYGEEGQGLIHQLGLTQHVDIVMGTFSKAYGTLGAYAVGNHNIINYILQTARSLMYTTALPPLIIHLIKHNWGVVKREGWRRESLQSNAHYLRRKLQEMGFNTGQSECHIIPIIVGANEQTLLFGQRLREEGVAAVAIRPPTVPEGTSRIRLSVMATHTEEQLQTAADIMKRVGTELEIIP